MKTETEPAVVVFFLHIQFTRFQTERLQSSGTYISDVPGIPLKNPLQIS